MQPDLLTTTDMPADTAPRLAHLDDGQTAELHESLGFGGMAHIYRCTYRSRDAALKVMRSRTGSEHEARSAEQMRKERECLTTLDHPHVPRMLATGTYDGNPCLVMDRIAGVNMDHLLAGLAGRRLRPDMLRRTAYDCARLLASMHGKGIAHGDVKPANIVLGRGRDDPKHLYPWMLDFNLSRSIADGLRPLRERWRTDLPEPRLEKYLVGTLAYMDPFMGKDPHNDMYGFGATMFQAWKGENLMPERATVFGAHAAPELFARSIEDRLQPSRRSERPWAELLKAIVCRPPDRRPGIGEILERLEGMKAHRCPPTVAPERCDVPEILNAVAEPILQATSSTRRAVYFALAGTGFLVLAAGGLTCSLLQKQTGEAQPADVRPEAPLNGKYPAAEALFRQPRSGETFRSSMIADPHRMRMADLTTDQLVVLLEEGKAGLSAGLPRRAHYPASLYTLRPGAADEEELLQLTRGAYHRRGGVTAFYPLSQVGGAPEAEAVRRFIAGWKKIDGGSADPKTLDRVNDRLRELRNAAGVK